MCIFILAGIPYHHMVFRALHVACDITYTLSEKLFHQVCKRSLLCREQRRSGRLMLSGHLDRFIFEVKLKMIYAWFNSFLNR